MSHVVWFRAPLGCLHCGSHAGAQQTRLYTSSFGRDPLDESVRLGDVLEVSLDDFADAYLTLRHPGDDPDVRALEQWSCPGCQRALWARLGFRREDSDHHRFVLASAVPLTPQTLAEVHYVSLRLAPWLETNPGEESGRIMRLLRPALDRAEGRAAADDETATTGL